MEFILKKIEEYKRIIIFGHVRPDGDCIGSQYGLEIIIKESYPDKEVYVSGENSKYVSFVGSPEMIDDSLFKGALAICVDVANADRISDQRYINCDYIIKIDHHPDIDQFGDYRYVDEKAPACAQIITEFYLKYNKKLKLTPQAAEALYVGILTDTGRFKFDSVKPQTFNMAAVLLDAGVNLGYVDDKLSVETINTLKLRGYCLENFDVTENGFAYLKITRDVINRFCVTDEQAANQVTSISTIEGCPSWALIIEYPSEIRIRLRSRGPIVNKLAEEYSGGGHPKAAGARLDSWDDLDGFLAKADKLVDDYKKSI